MDRRQRPFNEEPEEVSTEIEPNRKYNKTELGAIADAILREDAKAELCRWCEERGDPTGNTIEVPQEATDGEGNPLVLQFEEYACRQGHNWYEGEGRMRGIGGDNPILFEEHFQSRRRREIYTTQGVPDPNIVSGLYNRTHPAGRKVNSLEQRRKNGASWYR